MSGNACKERTLLELKSSCIANFFSAGLKSLGWVQAIDSILIAVAALRVTVKRVFLEMMSIVVVTCQIRIACLVQP